MRIYIASRYGRMEEMRPIASRLRAEGHVSTARWVEGAEETVGESVNGALMDLADVDDADALVLFGDKHGTSNVGGGRFFEFGYAYAKGKQCFVVQPGGKPELIFGHLPGVTTCANVEELMEYLRLDASRFGPKGDTHE